MTFFDYIYLLFTGMYVVIVSAALWHSRRGTFPPVKLTRPLIALALFGMVGLVVTRMIEKGGVSW